MHVAVLVALAVTAIGGVGVGHLRVAERKPAHLGVLVALDLVLVLLCSVAVWAPGTFQAWMQEDSFIEWATVFAFGTGAVLFGRQARAATATRHPWSRLFLVALAAFCVFVAGEEVSWGQRLLAFQPPEVFLEDNFQQELNVHNFLKDETLLGFPLDTRFVVALIAASYGVVLPAIVAFGWGRRVPFVERFLEDVSPPTSLVYVFAAVAWVELAYPIKLSGEAAELVLGLAFVATAWFRDPSHDERRWGGAVVIALPIALGVLTQPTVDRLLYGADEERVAEARTELAAIASDLSSEDAWIAKKWRKKDRVHKRMFSAIRSGYVRMGPSSRFLQGEATPADPGAPSPRRDRLGYLLDPWNNPYWIHFRRKDDTIIVYSFGPNRRRDSSFRRQDEVDLESLAGDDLGVALRVSDVLPAR